MSSKSNEDRPHRAGAFDIRTFIAVLIAVYGAVLLAMGLFATSEQDLSKAGGLNINLWAGIGMLVVAAAFQLWATRRPVVVPARFEAEEERTHVE